MDLVAWQEVSLARAPTQHANRRAAYRQDIWILEANGVSVDMLMQVARFYKYHFYAQLLLGSSF